VLGAPGAQPLAKEVTLGDAASTGAGSFSHRHRLALGGLVLLKDNQGLVEGLLAPANANISLKLNCKIPTSRFVLSWLERGAAHLGED
jgi:hypothetical protein